MREVIFIKQNKEKWFEYEQAIFGKIKKGPDYLANMYIQLMNDLSYSQTYYPKSKTTAYLNYLAVQTYQNIYKTKRVESNQLVHFYKFEVPLIVYQYKNYLIFSALLFFVLVGIGAISSHYDESFVRLILGDSYVNTTLNNIKDGDAMAIYQSGSNWGSFIGITFNNLSVGLRLFVYGIFGGLGTLVYLFHNAIMLGSFQYFFVQQGEFTESFKGIWLHGAMEIFSMVIEAFAGFILGASILFPKTFSRIDSFKNGFKNGFKIYIATVPFTILAGFIEGFVTRYAQQMPDILNYFIIFGTFILIFYYFVIYPKKVYRKIHN
ncbi:stage II sporulation protein M [Flavobacterium sp. NKUCC04_CG]|uniref:stage II sporulation protein M n=1 Tax=Flavobacterium sp. NKUCC04_CG TaxID=2842121 RepID=UPI001C5AA114|nr:stage II sporulation protein M [Flavobacterium sp. NKUCC04_CG]MBW3517988.1 stage II sporulation protein M [Flavobacterium sp. NKUCC04_CG]